MEEWKDVQGYEGLYQVSNTGQVRGVKRGKTLKPHKSKAGYLEVTLSKQNTFAYFLIHRLVAQAFIPNPEGKPQINHKNGVKTDNRLDNLEWSTRSENQRHRFSVLGQRGHTARPVRCVDTNEVYPSAKLAAQKLGLCRSAISLCCLGKRKSTGGYHFKFKED